MVPDRDVPATLNEEQIRAVQAPRVTRAVKRGAFMRREGENPCRVLVLTGGRATAVTFTDDGIAVAVRFMGRAEEQLAGWTGASREAVNALRHRPDLGWIEMGRRSVSGRDRETRRRFAR